MEHFEKLSLWLRYVDDTHVVWLHGLGTLQNFLNHLNNLRTSIQFTVETESHGMIAFLDGLVTRKGLTLTTKVHRKLPTVQCSV
jgi:hypothetical protein